MIPKEIHEVAINYIKGDDFITVSSTDKSWIKRIVKLHDENPESVIIKYMNADDSVVATMPKEYLRLKKPQRRSISDEHKAKLLEALKRSRE